MDLSFVELLNEVGPSKTATDIEADLSEDNAVEWVVKKED